MSAHRSRAVSAIGIGVLIAAHALVLHHVASRFSVPIGATLIVAALVVAKHVGLFRAVHARFRRRRA